MLSTPVALIAFNRPDAVRLNLQAIARVAPERLFVICDGPREDRPDDLARCAEVRELVTRIGWPCAVETKFADTNIGVEANVELGLDWVFDQVDRAIVLEDDCIADPTFFRFATELLERYREDRRIWQISGNSLGIAEQLFKGDSYAFSAWASVWGWATWADRWQQHRTFFGRDHQPSHGDRRGDIPRRTSPIPRDLPTLVTSGARRHFADAAASTDTHTHGWDKHWWLSMMTTRALAVTPVRSMVENIGFDGDATHTSAHVGAGAVYGAASPVDFPLQHPAAVVLDAEVERELELVLGRVGGRLAQTARRLIKSPMLRRLLRSAVSSRAAMAGARTVSRIKNRRSST